MYIVPNTKCCFHSSGLKTCTNKSLRMATNLNTKLDWLIHMYAKSDWAVFDILCNSRKGEQLLLSDNGLQFVLPLPNLEQPSKSAETTCTFHFNHRPCPLNLGSGWSQTHPLICHNAELNNVRLSLTANTQPSNKDVTTNNHHYTLFLHRWCSNYTSYIYC